MIAQTPAPVLGTRRDTEFARGKVDVANTAFWEGREYRISHEFLIDETPLVLRFTAPGDFMLQKQELEVDGGGIRMRAYRDSQGTEGGTFDTPVGVYKVNFMSDAPVVAHSVDLDTGGTFTPDVGQPAVETIRVVSPTQSNRMTTVSGSVGDARGLAAGVYYLVFDRINGNSGVPGVFSLTWEERAS